MRPRKHRFDEAAAADQDDYTIQLEQRARRRKHLPIVYTEGLDLLQEIDDLLRPLAKRITKAPAVFAADVDELATAVHRLVQRVADGITTAHHKRTVAHLNLPSLKERSEMLKWLADATERPAPPAISDGMLSSGEWARVLTDHVAPWSQPLSELLRRAHPPNAYELRGAPSASEIVVSALCEVDLAVLSFSKHLSRTEAPQKTLQRNAIGATKADAARAKLAALDIQV
ncbi:hypothetical protein [Mycobacterium sp.]|uniref:hypothetical protein n=1 Tax=Mycobacterium sp. TaxID=1785 RepID=UPI003F95384B